MGHLRRCQAIRDALHARGYLAEMAGHLPDGYGPNLILVDMPEGPADEAIREAKSRKVKTVSLEHPDGRYLADADITVRAEFAIVREPIRSMESTAGRDCLIMIGGADPYRHSRQAARVAHGITNRVTLILGPHAPDPGELPPSVEVVRCPDDLPERMARCGWAIVNGGTTLSEMLCLQKPCWVVPQNRRERSDANMYLERGAILGIGLLRATRPTKAQRREVARAAGGIVDGRGADRIADFLIERLRQYWV